MTEFEDDHKVGLFYRVLIFRTDDLFNLIEIICARELITWAPS